MYLEIYLEIQNLENLSYSKDLISSKLVSKKRYQIWIKVGQSQNEFLASAHTTQNLQNKWSKISDLGINIFGLKFGFSEKATKFEKIFIVLLTRAACSVRATAYTSKSRQRLFKTMMKCGLLFFEFQVVCSNLPKDQPDICQKFGWFFWGFENNKNSF